MSVLSQILPVYSSGEEEYPNTLDMRLCHRRARCLAFSPTGLYLAVGCADGAVVIWDFLARSLAMEGQAFAEGNAVTSIAWDASGRQLYAASAGMPDLFILDFERKVSRRLFTGRTAVASFCCSPTVQSLLLLVFASGKASIVDCSSGEVCPLRVDEASLQNARAQHQPDSSSKSSGSDFRGPASDVSGSHVELEGVSAVCFSHGQDWLLVGREDGEMLVVGATRLSGGSGGGNSNCEPSQGQASCSRRIWFHPLAVVGRDQFSVGSKRKRVISLRVSASNRFVVANCGTVTMYVRDIVCTALATSVSENDVGAVHPEKVKSSPKHRNHRAQGAAAVPSKRGRSSSPRRRSSTNRCDQREPTVQCTLVPRARIQDLINRQRYASCALSGDGEYIVGGDVENMNVTIWRVFDGQPVEHLSFPANGASAVAWHPKACFVTAVDKKSGAVYIWGRERKHQWTAFAPNFVPITEHQNSTEYMEREDEWDLNPRDPASLTAATDRLVMSGKATEGDLSVAVDVHSVNAEEDSLLAPLRLSVVIRDSVRHREVLKLRKQALTSVERPRSKTSLKKHGCPRGQEPLGNSSSTP